MEREGGRRLGVSTQLHSNNCIFLSLGNFPIPVLQLKKLRPRKTVIYFKLMANWGQNPYLTLRSSALTSWIQSMSADFPKPQLLFPKVRTTIQDSSEKHFVNCKIGNNVIINSIIKGPPINIWDLQPYLLSEGRTHILEIHSDETFHLIAQSYHTTSIGNYGFIIFLPTV